MAASQTARGGLPTHVSHGTEVPEMPGGAWGQPRMLAKACMARSAVLQNGFLVRGG
jgi:hypothetical protein